MAPLKPLEKSESSHSFTYLGPLGYQYQRGLSNSLEAGLDVTITFLGLGLGTNLRYHVVQKDSAFQSIQLGVSTEGAKANYMFTRRFSENEYFRFGPNLSYRKELMRNGISQGFTSRIGGSITYGVGKTWYKLGYTIPINKEYDDNDSESELYGWGWLPDNPQTGDPIYNLEIKLGFSF